MAYCKGFIHMEGSTATCMSKLKDTFEALYHGLNYNVGGGEGAPQLAIAQEERVYALLFQLVEKLENTNGLFDLPFWLAEWLPTDERATDKELSGLLLLRLETYAQGTGPSEGLEDADEDLDGLIAKYFVQQHWQKAWQAMRKLALPTATLRALLAQWRMDCIKAAVTYVNP
eukprot:TRINITY_DN13004_c0_g1_i1.p1 TRINITY_DN13004_c0_g1~~TRINITY_DN13004_c0_g1_i1.p1  ORF type:complete len:172 (+),score=34.23 TRINITY_DN13004_c0_g1_i1:880-1395(+)